MGSQVEIRLAQETDESLWNRFVDQHEQCGNYHRWGWKSVIENTFRWPTFYLAAHGLGEPERIQGILPLVWQKSWMFGSFLTSLPFLNGGGIVSDSVAAKGALLGRAIGIATELAVDYLELRQRVDPQLSLPVKKHKVAMVRPVGPDEEMMWAELPHKVRTDIRRGINSGLEACFGGDELLDDFYDVFAANMRDLGTPVYDRKFFSEMLRTFPNHTYICIVRYKHRPVACSFLVGYKDTLEAEWSASLYSYSSLKPNMFLYWKILCFAGARGYQVFDFGRSSIDSGTHRFKKQWDTQEVPLYWAYWVPNGSSLPEVNKENPRYKRAISLWQLLPVSFTKLIGPSIVKRLP